MSTNFFFNPILTLRSTWSGPQLAAALDYVGDGDTLIVHSMDRLARNTEDLLRIVRELTAKQVSVEFVKERLTFNGQSDDPMAHLMMTMLGGFAQFERSLIRERQREGIAIAKEKGIYKGRKPSLTGDQVEALRQRVAAGDKKAVVAREDLFAHAVEAFNEWRAAVEAARAIGSQAHHLQMQGTQPVKLPTMPNTGELSVHMLRRFGDGVWQQSLYGRLPRVS
ncbi:recombinase family protein [Paraburkholderia elongata]